jgi:hypothetical protein
MAARAPYAAHRTLILALVIAAQGCATATSRGLEDRGAPAPSQPSASLRLPPAVGVFRLASRRNFPDARAGTLFRYLAVDSLYVDVIVYPGPDLASGCNLECGASALEREVAEFEPALQAMVAQGTLQSVAVHSRGPLPAPPDSAWKLGAFVRASTGRNGRTERSDLYLYYLPRVRVKVRATFLDTESRGQAVDEFVRELLPLLAANRT